MKPILDALRGMHRIVTWKTPSLTIIIFTVSLVDLSNIKDDIKTYLLRLLLHESVVVG